MSYLILAARLLLVGVFLVSLVSKLRSRTAYLEFVSATAALLATPLRRARPIAAATIGAEIGIVVLLAVQATVALGLGTAAVTLVCFACALVRALRRGAAPPCHCFGRSATPMGVPHVIRNFMLAAVATVAVVCLGAGAETAVSGGGATLTATVVVVCVLCTTRLDDLVELFRGPPSPD